MSPSTLALNTSKRKFYKLLDNLSSSKTNVDKHASSTTKPTEPPNKRIRPLSAPYSASRPKSMASARSTSSVRAIGGATTDTTTKPRPKSYAVATDTEKGDSADAERKTSPNYSPWDQDQFLLRLKSFADVRSWTPKVGQIGEVEWAKRGWVVVGKDTVCCKGGCDKRLVVRVGEEDGDEGNDGAEDGEKSWWMADVEREMVQRYKDMIVEGHDEHCLWRKAGCKDDIYRIKMADPVVWQRELKERYESLLTVESALPDRGSVPRESLSGQKVELLVSEIRDSLPLDLLHKPEKEKENTQPLRSGASIIPTLTAELPLKSKSASLVDGINEIALTLAMCGWTGQNISGVQLAYCPRCFQRIGLWLYQSSIRPKSATSARADENSMIFDPVGLHREHCPWSNSETQCAVGNLQGLAGWEVLVVLVKGSRRRGGPTESRTTFEASDIASDGEESTPRKSREEIEREDQVRKSRLQRLKRAFTVSKKSKPLS